MCDEVRNFMLEGLDNNYSSLQDLREEIDHISIPKKRFASKKTLFSGKLLAFLYSSMVNFCKTNKVKEIPLSQKFIENIRAIMENTHCIHHSHVTGEIKGYVHSFCNKKVRENYFKIPLVAHNLFRFDFFFLLTGLRSSVWRTIDITIGEKKPTDINFASIGNQVKFLDTIKYFQQSLGGLASSLTDKEREAIYRECEKFLLSDSVHSKRFLLCTKEEKKWEFDYLSSGKGAILYKLIADFDSLNITPDNEFFYLINFIQA